MRLCRAKCFRASKVSNANLGNICSWKIGARLDYVVILINEDRQVTTNRTAFLAIVMAYVAMIVACAGGGKNGNTNSDRSTEGSSAAKLSVQSTQVAANEPALQSENSTVDDSDEEVIREAIIQRDKATEAQKQIRAENELSKRRSEEELLAYKQAMDEYEKQLAEFSKAKVEYDALVQLDAVKLSYTKNTQEFAYRSIVKRFPATAAAKEAQRRLDGEVPKLLAVASPPIEPKKPNSPQQFVEKPLPSIPEVPTLAEVREHRKTATATGPAPTSKQVTTPVSPPKSGMVWVNGYRRKDGTYVSGYWRRR
jgi:hypothetical protein